MTAPSPAPLPTADRVFQAVTQVTFPQEQLLYRVVQAEFYAPATFAERDIVIALALPSCGLLECLGHSGKYRATLLGYFVVKALLLRRG